EADGGRTCSHNRGSGRKVQIRTGRVQVVRHPESAIPTGGRLFVRRTPFMPGGMTASLLPELAGGNQEDFSRSEGDSPEEPAKRAAICPASPDGSAKISLCSPNARLAGRRGSSAPPRAAPAWSGGGRTPPHGPAPRRRAAHTPSSPPGRSPPAP